MGEKYKTMISVLLIVKDFKSPKFPMRPVCLSVGALVVVYFYCRNIL